MSTIQQPKAPTQHLFHRRLKQFMSQVESINEDLNELTQVSPQKPPPLKKTHKIITSSSNLDLFSSNSIPDFDAPTASSVRKPFSNSSSAKLRVKPRDNCFSEELDRVSLKSEMSLLNLDSESCFLSLERVVEVDSGKKDGYEYDEWKAAEALQRYWRMKRVRRNYQKILRKIKLAEVLAEGLTFSLRENAGQEKKMEKLRLALEKTKKFQKKMEEKIRVCDGSKRKKEKKVRVVSCMELEPAKN